MSNFFASEFEIGIKSLLEAIHVTYSYDFRQYASGSMKRRITHAMSRMGCHTIRELQDMVLGEPSQFDDLLQFITIPVSEMFRNPLYFKDLRENVLPMLRTFPSLKVWVAGCSTGEEAYSLAILLHEEGLLERTILYATDINQRSLEQAARGVFSLQDFAKFERSYQSSGGIRTLTDYCTTAFGSAKIDRVLQKNITFADHSLATDMVFSEVHLISCRNVLIYFNRDLQERAFGLFADSLCRNGFLGLGPEETIKFSSQAKYFERLAGPGRILRKTMSKVEIKEFSAKLN